MLVLDQALPMESIVRTATNTGGGVTCPFSDEGAVATEGNRLAKGVQLMPTDLIEPRSDSKAKAAENNLCGKEKRRFTWQIIQADVVWGW